MGSEGAGFRGGGRGGVTHTCKRGIGVLNESKADRENTDKSNIERKKNQKDKKEYCFSRREIFVTCTSILRPSTTVPCNFSLALSASALHSKVTKPKPCMQVGEGGEQHAHH